MKGSLRKVGQQAERPGCSDATRAVRICVATTQLERLLRAAHRVRQRPASMQPCNREAGALQQETKRWKTGPWAGASGGKTWRHRSRRPACPNDKRLLLSLARLDVAPTPRPPSPASRLALARFQRRDRGPGARPELLVARLRWRPYSRRQRRKAQAPAAPRPADRASGCGRAPGDAGVGQHQADDEALVVVEGPVLGVSRRRRRRRGHRVQPGGLWQSCSNCRASRLPICRERALIWLQ